jgi:hypothetical protein
MEERSLRKVPTTKRWGKLKRMLPALGSARQGVLVVFGRKRASTHKNGKMPSWQVAESEGHACSSQTGRHVAPYRVSVLSPWRCADLPPLVRWNNFLPLAIPLGRMPDALVHGRIAFPVWPSTCFSPFTVLTATGPGLQGRAEALKNLNWL